MKIKKLTKMRIKFLMELSKDIKRPITAIGRKIFKTNVSTYQARDYLIDEGFIEMDFLSCNREYAMITKKGTAILQEITN